MANSSKFRADQVGSLLRPARLLEARRRLEADMIDAEELRIVEDEEITEAVKRQKAAGIDVITDGEFRRRDFRSGFADAVDGVEMRTVEMPWRGESGTVALPSKQYVITGRIKQRQRMTEGDVAFLRTLTTAPLKVTLIAPGFLVDRFWIEGVTNEFYDSREELAAEVAAITRAEIEALFAEGVQYVQLDNPGYSAFLGEYTRERSDGLTREQAFDQMLRTDIASIEGVELPHRTYSIGMHVCRGNQSSMWLGEGDYEAVAERLFSELPVQRLLLEYDSDRAGGFAPLRFVPDGKMVVLGLVSSKSPELETIDELQARIDEAIEYVDWNYLALSPQCGFASVAEGGNELTQDQQYDKLQLVSDTALATWGIEL
jgi:5-methyltetrahydropteroyltriglutamate--homocysteine methyltransferase